MSFERRHGAKAAANGWMWLVALLASLSLGVSAAIASAQRSFASPEEAVKELVKAVKAGDRTGTLAVLGQNATDWISSGDKAADQADIQRFIAAYDAKHGITRDGDKAILELGTNDFPFAFPLVQSGKRWRFDTVAGKEEMLARRIGANELGAIKVLQAIVDAQMDYASEDRDGDGVPAYAQKFESSPGKRDGLYWPVKAGEEMSPLGPLLARASSEGFRKGNVGPTPYHGYYYRMLKGQGKNAPSGALDYAIQWRAIGGFAILAYPARYGNSGIMSFMVSQEGKIYQADLGPETAAKALQMQEFDPGPGWSLFKAP